MPDPAATPTITDDGYWKFDSFAVAIDQPRRLRDYERRAVTQPATVAQSAADTAQHSTPRIRHPLALSTPVAEGELRTITHDSLGALVITNVDGQLHVIQERCPHAEASLGEGFQEGHRLICPLHFAEFDLRDGSVHKGPVGCPPAKVYAVTVEDNRTWI